MAKLIPVSDDTLGPAKFPAGSQAELRYRPGMVRESRANYETTAWVFGGSMMVAVATVCFRLGGFAAHPLALSLMVLASVILAVILFARRAVPGKLILALPPLAIGVWFFIKTLATVTDPLLAFFVLVPVAAVSCWWVSDRIATYYVEYQAADPLITRDVEAELLGRWKQRTSNAGFLFALVLLGGCYAAGVVLLLGVKFSGTTFLGPAIAVLVMLGLMIAATIVRLGGIGQQAWATASILWQALSLWFTYEVHRSAPGLLRLQVRPFGSLSTGGRVVLFLGSLWFASMALLPASRYFPLLYAWSGGEQETMRSPDVKQLTDREVIASLTTKQKELLERLKGSKQGDYLDALKLIDYDERYQAALSEIAAEQTDTFTANSEAWIAAAMGNFYNQPTLALWQVTTAGFLSAIAPVGFFGCIFGCCYGPLVGKMLIDIVEASADIDTYLSSRWEDHVTTMQNSSDKTERDSLWLGLHDAGDFPVMLHREILHEHAHILGDSGSGKTALGLSPMLAQLIRMAGRDADGPPKKRSSCVVIDLKGDPALFHSARIEAKQAGLPFKWFTNQTGSATYSFNPLLQSHVSFLSPNQRSELLLEALGLAYGEGYGRGHFSRSNRQVLSRIMQGFEGKIQSFADLYEFSKEGKRDLLGSKLNISQKEREDAGDVFAAIEGLAAFDALNVTADSGYGEKVVSEAIDFADVLATPQVVYFYLPSSIEAATVREIGKLALFSLLSAAIHAEATSGTQNQVYLMIDEFQQIISENLEVVLRQARSKRIAAILANQTISDLDTPSANLIPTVQANTRFKQFFAATDLEQQDQLMRASGETIQYMMEWEEQELDYQRGSSRLRPDFWLNPPTDLEMLSWGNRFNRNDLIRLSDDETLSMVHIPRGKGYTQFGGFPFVLQSEFHISEQTYIKRTNMPWPQVEDSPGAFIPGAFEKVEPSTPEVAATPPTPPPQQSSEPEPTPPKPSNQERFASLLGNPAAAKRKEDGSDGE